MSSTQKRTLKSCFAPYCFAGLFFGASITINPVAHAASHITCEATQSFAQFKKGIENEALEAGVDPKIVHSIVPLLQFSKKVLERDRKQGVFAQSFLQFSDRMVAPYRITGGRDKLKHYSKTFKAIETEYGVPGAVISAFWALETDFGAVLGDFNTLNALATLAYDCRRPELFRPQLIAALKLLDRGDLTPRQMRGAWAGELGQLQILPSDYLLNGVDFNRDGRVDLLNTTEDVLATGGKFLRHLGWRRGQPWIEEVLIPEELPWEETGIHTTKPTNDWAKLGVRTRGGAALAGKTLPASLILPMGRRGPAFLSYPNFRVFLEWNKSLVYTTSAAYLAMRIDGAVQLRRGDAPDILSFEQTKELQAHLQERGYDVGKIDGIIGAGTRAAVRDIQLGLGEPADAWPTLALLNRLAKSVGKIIKLPPPPRPRPKFP